MSKLLPYETIVKAHEGDPDAIDTILSHYAGYIRYCSKVHGKINTEVEEYVKQKLITALFKFRFDPLIDSKQKIKEARDFMKNQLLTVTEVVVRSAFYIITNYVFVSMGLSFHTHWIAILFLLSMVWATIDYGKSVNKITGKKVISEILCICCIAISIAIAYFVGYIQGAIISF